jgi:hypothetical protein
MYVYSMYNYWDNELLVVVIFQCRKCSEILEQLSHISPGR